MDHPRSFYIYINLINVVMHTTLLNVVYMGIMVVIKPILFNQWILVKKIIKLGLKNHLFLEKYKKKKKKRKKKSKKNNILIY